MTLFGVILPIIIALAYCVISIIKICRSKSYRMHQKIAEAIASGILLWIFWFVVLFFSAVMFGRSKEMEHIETAKYNLTPVFWFDGDTVMCIKGVNQDKTENVTVSYIDSGDAVTMTYTLGENCSIQYFDGDSVPYIKFYKETWKLNWFGRALIKSNILLSTDKTLIHIKLNDSEYENY